MPRKNRNRAGRDRRAGGNRSRASTGSKHNGAAIGLLTGVSLLVAGVDTASAGTLSQMYSFSTSAQTIVDENETFDSDEDSDEATFDLFNGPGELTQVKFTLMSTQNGGIEANDVVDISATCDEEGCGAEADMDIDYKVTINVGGVSPFVDEDFAPVECSAEGGGGVCSNATTLSEFFNDMATFVKPANEATVLNFIGAGTFGVDFDLDLAHESADEGDLNNYVSNGAVAWNGKLTVEYTFTDPVFVPEPGSLAMFGVGLGGLAWARRRRKAT